MSAEQYDAPFSSRIEIVTPDMARAWLAATKSSHFRQRHLRPDKVARYAAMILAGDFLTTPQGIILGPGGIVYDAQHRLHAIVLANKAMRMQVARYLTNEGAGRAAAVIDAGDSRTLGDRAMIGRQVDDLGSERAAVARAYLNFLGRTRGATDQELFAIMQRQAEDFGRVRAIGGGKRALTAVVAAAFVLMRPLESGRIDDLLARVRSGAGLNQMEAVLKRLVDTRISGGSECRANHMHKLVRAIEYVLEGRTVSNVQAVEDRAAHAHAVLKRLASA